MKAPLSWLKEYVDITLKPEVLAEKLTEVGLGCEKIERVDGDVIFELEITPNRPDCLSIIGIAREIAAIENKKITLPKVDITIPKKTELPIKLKTDYKLFYRWTGIVIKDITIKPSPVWMQERLKKIGLRPINNLVDITNYVMFELGIPLHAFDYDEIKGHEMMVQEAKGGEKFTSVDDKTYYLPKDAIVIYDEKRLIDLAGIKGGLNSGITNKTKNVFIHMTVDDPVHIRRASQALSLRSDASGIYEKGPDKGGTVVSLKRAASLVLELAGGEIASDIIDLKKESFEPWTVTLTHEHLTKVLGIDLEPKKVIELLERLSLSTTMNEKLLTINYAVTVPTYRNDLKIPEDIIEEVARLYGYNNFSKTLPVGAMPTEQIPYFRDYRFEERIKRFIQAAGFSEVYTYSLVSEKDLEEHSINSEDVLRVDNPVSRDYEYLRTTIRITLRKGLKQNLGSEKNVNLFELGKVYRGKSIADAKEEYMLSAISNTKSYFEVKGILERLFSDFGIDRDPTQYIQIFDLDDALSFEIPYTVLTEKAHERKQFVPLPKYPPIIEDLTLIADQEVKTGHLIQTIKKQSALIADVSLLDQYRQTRTFHIIYQHKDRNLTNKEVREMRSKIIEALKKTYKATIK